MPSVKKIQVTFDCAEPERVARFWCEVLGYVVPPPPEEFATWDDFQRSLPPEEQGSWFACVDPSGAGPRLFFQRVPEGKVAKNRVHLDVRECVARHVGRDKVRDSGNRSRKVVGGVPLCHVRHSEAHCHRQSRG